MSLRKRGAASAVLMIVCASGLPAAASAQGFFSGLFGWGGSPAPVSPPQAARPSLPAPVPPAFGHRAPPYGSHHDRSNDASPHERGKYRTMCVRLCDGYYWPLSNNVGRGRFYRDAQACRASCGEDARLFFHSASSGDASEMVDQQGRAYTSLPNAFRYRKKLTDGCRCKPEPWSESELNRHRIYAMHDLTRRLSQSGEGGEVVFSPTPAGVVVAGEYRHERPEALARPADGDGQATAGTERTAETATTGIAAPATLPPASQVAAGPEAVRPSDLTSPQPLRQGHGSAGRRTRQPTSPQPQLRQAAAGQLPKRTTLAAKAPGNAPYDLGGPQPAKRWPGD